MATEELYERWHELVRQNAGAIALREIGGAGRCWTFGELDAWAAATPAREGRVAVVNDSGADLVRSTLAAWRAGKVVCPTEPGAGETLLAFDNLPLEDGIAHLKRACVESGEPTWITLTANQLAADAAGIVEAMGLQPAVPNLGVISLAHSFGFSNLVLPLLLHGIPLYLLADGLPENLRTAFSLLRAEGQTCVLPAVPALWGVWQLSSVLDRDSPVTLAISAGATLPLALEQAVWQSAGLKIHNFYGSSECGGIAFDDTEEPRTEETCVGRPLPGVNLCVGAAGNLVVQSPAVGTGYWPQPCLQRLREGGFATPDAGYLSGGRVFLTRRLDDVLNIAGRKVAPVEIENVLRKLDGVQRATVFTIPDVRGGMRTEYLIAAVQLAENADLPTIRKAASAVLPDWQRPRRWWIVKNLEHQDFPTRAVLRQRYQNEVCPRA